MTRNPDSSPSSSSSDDLSPSSEPSLADDLRSLLNSPRQAVLAFFPPGEDPPPPVEASNPPTMTTSFTQAQFDDFLKAVSKTPSSQVKLTPPRLGGQNSTGVWTGYGAGELQKEPTSANCMRAFNTDVLKNHQAVKPIETTCKAGLKDSPELLFCMLNEPNAKTIIYSIHSFEDLMVQSGMDGVFTIIKDDGTKTNMLREPGMISTDLVKTWCKDVLEDGVWEYDTTNHTQVHGTVCEYDRVNMIWSGKALLNSCTVTLKEDLKLSVPASERNGPRLFMSLLAKLYRPSQSKIKALTVLLEGLDITKYPGENVTLFVGDAIKLIREIRMNFMTETNVPDLTTSALTGLTKCSDPLLLQMVRETTHG